MKKVKLYLSFSLTLLLIPLVLVSVSAGTNSVKWEDLDVKLRPYNPMVGLSIDQKITMQDIRNYLDKRQKTGALEPENQARLDELIAVLEKQGVEVKKRLAKADKESVQGLQNLKKGMTAKFDGKEIEISGYVVPLGFESKGVTEFLLVPWVGACIHTPPPAPDQIIQVKTHEPYLMKSIEQPVTIAGRVKVTMEQSNVYIVDGRMDLTIGYAMVTERVRDYKK